MTTKPLIGYLLLHLFASFAKKERAMISSRTGSGQGARCEARRTEVGPGAQGGIGGHWCSGDKGQRPADHS